MSYWHRLLLCANAGLLLGSGTRLFEVDSWWAAPMWFCAGLSATVAVLTD